MKIFSLSLVLFLLVPISALAARNDMFAKMPEFSAIMIMKSDGNTQSMKFNYTKKKQRAEPMGQASGGGIVITRLDKDVVWILMPEDRQYMEMELTRKNANPMTATQSVVKVQKVGEDTVEGHRCVKNKVTVKEKDGSQVSMYAWVANDLGWPIQGEAMDGGWRYTFTDIKIAKQDPSLFEIPAGYEKMEGFRGPSARDFAPEPPVPSAPEPYVPAPPAPDVPSIPVPPIPW